jgi:SAM-dependent methyltransferase
VLEDRWLAEEWRFAAAVLPPSPAAVLELGCGSSGGFVPALRSAGYDALGVDPRAPEGQDYRRIEFEDYRSARQVDALVACTSLHHVANLDRVLDLIDAALGPGGTVVVIEWAREKFDEATAQWCFNRLPVPAADAEPNWLARQHDEWAASGLPWDGYIRACGIHYTAASP